MLHGPQPFPAPAAPCTGSFLPAAAVGWLHGMRNGRGCRGHAAGRVLQGDGARWPSVWHGQRDSSWWSNKPGQARAHHMSYIQLKKLRFSGTTRRLRPPNPEWCKCQWSGDLRCATKHTSVDVMKEPRWGLCCRAPAAKLLRDSGASTRKTDPYLFTGAACPLGPGLESELASALSSLSGYGHTRVILVHSLLFGGVGSMSPSLVQLAGKRLASWHGLGSPVSRRHVLPSCRLWASRG